MRTMAEEDSEFLKKGGNTGIETWPRDGEEGSEKCAETVVFLF